MVLVISTGAIFPRPRHYSETPGSFDQEQRSLPLYRRSEHKFNMLKHILTSAPPLQHCYQDLEYMLETDASDGVIASVELKYAVHDKDMLALVRSFGHFRAEFAGTPHKILYEPQARERTTRTPVRASCC